MSSHPQKRFRDRRKPARLKLLLGVLVLTGHLATANPMVLEHVAARRLKNGWGMTIPPDPDTVLIAVDDCAYLDWQGTILAKTGIYPAHVVDCLKTGDTPLAVLHLAADVNAPELNHQWATIYIWNNTNEAPVRPSRIGGPQER
jgi:hypothetical protein